MMYFEDLEPGTKSSFGRYEVTRDEVVEFAGKYDPQPFHLSDEGAAKTHFKKLAASGWHTMGMVMRMQVDNMGIIQQAGLGSPGIDEIRWLKPVYPGDVLRCETELLDKTPSRSKPEIGSFRSKTTVFNQNDEPVMSMIAIGLIRRRPA
ncbi:MAG: MaoC family dehydratase [Pseudomonadota bacterium]